MLKMYTVILVDLSSSMGIDVSKKGGLLSSSSSLWVSRIAMLKTLLLFELMQFGKRVIHTSESLRRRRLRRPSSSKLHVYVGAYYR